MTDQTSQTPADPWAHRSQRMRCRTCMWFVPKAPPAQATGTLASASALTVSAVQAAAKPSVGRCRRHAPTMNGYPVVFSDDWCGDHKLDEAKV